jgi:hypothetical protein
MSFLHITNGSAVIPKIREAGIDGRIVPWDDVLHEGPVPAGLNTAALRDVRAQFIASSDGSFADVVRSFLERDRALENLQGLDEIVLWLEHDLYDQLQLIQILDRLPLDGMPVVSAVPDDDYLGTQPAVRFAGLFPARRELTSAQRLAARDAWDVFRSDDPRHIQDALPRLTVLSHLGPALRRHLEQFPSTSNGLSRTEQQTLEAVARGVSRLADVYVEANHKREDAVFMGDLAFLFHIRSLVHSTRPLLALRRDPDAVRSGTPTPAVSLADEIALTDDGRRVLALEADRVRLCGIDRWLGGVHLAGTGPMWRWDPQRQALRIQ